MVRISFNIGDYCCVTVLSIMENQILKAIEDTHRGKAR